MELKELNKNILAVTGCENIKTLKEKLMEDMLSKNNDILDNILNLIEFDLETDYFQKIQQFYEADRTGLKQDFTPKSLARLLPKLIDVKNANWCYDLCSGTGTLTLQAWLENKNLKVICEELDKNVIPFLLANLSMRNIEGYVVNADALTGEVFIKYKLIKGDKYSLVSITDDDIPKADVGISNPPYNLRWKPTGEYNVPESNANYVFVNKLLDCNKAAFILPNGSLTSTVEKECRKNLIDGKKIIKIITMPDRMFESTSIPVFVMLTGNCEYITMIDHRSRYDIEEREQAGESHTRNRIYKKEFKILTDEHIKKIVRTTETEVNYSKKIQETQDYNLMPARYIETEIHESESRPVEDIVTDLNRIIRERNVLKITINEKWAKELKIFELSDLKNQSNEINRNINMFLENKFGLKLDNADYITLTKSKELKIENKDKELMSCIMTLMMPVWTQHIFYLNTEENRLLAELRDKLLPLLMSGQININKI